MTLKNWGSVTGASIISFGIWCLWSGQADHGIWITDPSREFSQAGRVLQDSLSMYSDKWTRQALWRWEIFQTLLQKLRIWHYFFFLPIIFKPYCVSKEIQSSCFCFFKTLLFCKSYLMSQSLMSLNKAICFPIEGCSSLQGTDETRTWGILDLTDLYHISRVSLKLEFPFMKSISLWNCSQQLH